jgi:hypothetical protein
MPEASKPSINLYADTHEAGDLHYHVSTTYGQKQVFKKFEKMLPNLLPEGYTLRLYHEDDIGVLDSRNCQHMHIYYRRRYFGRFHPIHITFNQDTFKPTFTEFVQKCFPKAEISWTELATEEVETE